MSAKRERYDADTTSWMELQLHGVTNEHENQQCRHLLAEILRQAFDDLRGVGCPTGACATAEEEKAYHKRKAIEWVFDDYRGENDAGSIRWVCNLLAISLDTVRARASVLARLSKEEAARLWTRNVMASPSKS